MYRTPEVLSISTFRCSSHPDVCRPLTLCLLAHALLITLRHGLGLRHAFDMEK